MITINLKPGAKRQSASRPAFGGFKEQFAGLTAGIKDPWAMAAGAACVVVVLGLGALYLQTGARLGTLEPELEEARTEHLRYQGFLRQKRQAERVRDSILVQIGTIASVDGNRYVWAHILDEIGSALPEMTWLTQVAQISGGTIAAAGGTGEEPPAVLPPPVLRIVGRTADLQRYTAFLRQLEASPWLANVLPVQAKTIVEGNRALTEFTIQATYSTPDSSYVRTVPILESVVED